MTSKKKIIVCIAVIIALAIAGAVGSAVLTKLRHPPSRRKPSSKRRKTRTARTPKQRKNSRTVKNDSSYQDGAGHVFLRVDKLSNLSSGDKKKLYSAVADFTSEEQLCHGLPDSER